MSASLSKIKRWLDQGESIGATHTIIALDDFDKENYPVYVMPGQSAEDQVKRLQAGKMQSVDEVYDLSMNIDKQLSASHTWNT